MYTIWRGSEFIYVGMGGRGIAGTDEKMKDGLRGRLKQHESGDRSGDKFCVYVFDRLLLCDLTRQQIEDAASGKISLDHEVRAFVHKYLSYRYILTTDRPDGTAAGRVAEALEKQIQHEELGGQLPLLNPARTRPPATDVRHSSVR